jgi:predicted O-methyltransferase YrrM
MPNFFETGNFPLKLNDEGLRKGRSAKDGYARGWGLEYGGMREEVLADPVYKEALSLASGRTIQAEACRMNLFLLARYFLPRMLEQSGSSSGSIFEFGSYRGGSAIFLAAVCRGLGLNVRVYGLDTFDGMPPTDKNVDAHDAGDFSGVDLAELRAYIAECGLADRLEFVKGTFDETAPAQLAGAAPLLLAHIDCDVRTSVAYAWEAVQPWIIPGGYVVFDDANSSGCLGATEVVEDLAIRRDGLNCEQIWPHFVFRIWPQAERAKTEIDKIPEHALLGYRLRIQRLEGELALSSQNSVRAQQRHDQCLADLGETRSRLQQTLFRLEELEAAHLGLDRVHAHLQKSHDQCLADLDETRERREQTLLRLKAVEAAQAELNRAHGLLKRQVSMARTSRWLRLGRLFRIGPSFDIPE